MTPAVPLVVPEIRFGAATLPALLLRAAASDFACTVQRHGAEPRRLTFVELSRRASAVASGLRARGVRRGDRVCLLSPTSSDLLVAIWGVWAAGGAVVMLAPPLRPAHLDGFSVELTHRYHQADARLLLMADDLAEPLADQVDHLDVLPIGRLEDCDGDGPIDHTHVVPDDLAVLQFTSGTTARSRAVVLTHRQLLSNLSAFSDALGLSAADRGVSWLPLYHDMGLVIMIAAVAHAADLLLLPTEDFVRRPGVWTDALSAFRATVTVGPNMGYALATKDLNWRPRELDLSGLRILGNGAEPIDAVVLEHFLEQAGRHGVRAESLCPMYGLAEAVLAVTVSAPDRTAQEVWVDRETLASEQVARSVPPGTPAARRLVGCGRPVPGTEVEIRDEHGRVLLEHQAGEIWVRSPSIMSGYFRDEGATADVLQDGWLSTGDRGFRRDGELVVCGRSKDMITVAGRNLYPEDYEQLVAGREGIRHGSVAAFGMPDRERMVVVAESTRRAERAQRLVEDVLAALTRELSHAPEEVVLVRPGTLPKTSSGKVQRDLCRRRYRSAELAVVASARRR